jgi:hypothetical protein
MADRFAALWDRLRAHPRVRVSDAVTPDEIAIAERSLGVPLPDDYRSFLRSCGQGKVGYNDLLGLGPDAKSYESVVHATREEQRVWPALIQEVKEHFDELPVFSTGYVVVMHDGMGGCYCLDTERMQSGQCPVIWWDHELLEASTVADTFEEWVEGMLADKDLSPLFRWARGRT